MFRIMLLLLCYTLVIISCTLLLQFHFADRLYGPIDSIKSAHHGLNLRWFSHSIDKAYPSDSSNLCSAGDVSSGNTTNNLSCELFHREETEAPTDNTTPAPKYVLLDSNEELNFHCNHCALVFSSGHLLHSEMGREIDNAECVIRQNTASIHRYWKDVGTRTTVRVIGHVNLKSILSSKIRQSELLYSRKTRPDYFYVPWLYEESINRTSDRVFQVARELQKKNPWTKFYFQSDQRIKEMDRKFMVETGLNRSEIETWFSTGYMSMVFALDVCENVVCYGLADAEYCSREPKSEVKYHYFDRDDGKHNACSYINERENLVKGGHKFLTERRLYARWAQERNLTFRAPEWPESAFNITQNFTSQYLSVYKKAKGDGTFANFTRNANTGKKDPKPQQPKVRRPLLRKFQVRHRIPPPAHEILAKIKTVHKKQKR